MESSLAKDKAANARLLTATNDDHGGVVVEMREAMDGEVFAVVLRDSIAQWRKQEGFWYHHAEPSYLMLVYWIPVGAHTLPVNASHRVGVGAFVMNEKREVLVVKEKNGILRGRSLWKFPTGVVDEGEDICVAAVREVKEETAIDTEFVEVLAFRQSHGMFFGKSDLFFLCMLRPLSFDIQKQDEEIEAAQWMAWEEYEAQPFIQRSEFLKNIGDVCIARQDGNYAGFSPVPVALPLPSHSAACLFLNVQKNTATG